jgi:potassium channel subfamily K
MGITAIILVFLTFNLLFLHRQTKEGLSNHSNLTVETRRLHQIQREFMVQTLLFFLYLGIVSLIMSQVEGITYVDGIYFEVVTTLTIGFGDIAPQTAVMKVLIFPFTILGITLLALVVRNIVRLLSDRAHRRKLALKHRLKYMLQEKKRTYNGYGSKLRPWAAIPPKPPKLERSATLQEELVKLRLEDWKRERRANLRSMAIGLIVFFIFWLVGAMIFSFVEVSPSHWVR